MSPIPDTPLHLGLIGHPLGHSLSPRLHQAALHACELEGDYTLLPVQPFPAGLPELKRLLSELRSGSLHGLNVTIPHKRAVLPHLDEMTDGARAVGAVNTLVCRDHRIIGDNTDAPGFLVDLQSLLAGCPLPPEPSALVLGAGGSARAVVFALAASGWEVTIASRRSEQSDQLAASLSAALSSLTSNSPLSYSYSRIAPPLSAQIGRILASTWPSPLSRPFTLVVNATPLGMWPDIQASAWPEDLPFPPEAAVYDLVYNPAETRLVRCAREAGLCATGGLGMLVEQAALAFEIWTGLQAPRLAMRRAVTSPTEYQPSIL